MPPDCRERRAAARQAAAEEAEDVLSLEEKEVLEKGDTAKHVAEQAKDVAKAKDDTELEVTIIQEVDKKIEEIKDEVVPNSEYEYMTTSKDDPPTESNPVEEHPPPVRDRSVGGIDYYSLSYDDSIFKNGYT